MTEFKSSYVTFLAPELHFASRGVFLVFSAEKTPAIFVRYFLVPGTSVVLALNSVIWADFATVEI